ncbi:hypothetical protein MAPG_01803 [Magnaporthiopsis poae ATCC 64411]|uniref:Uncharacterized protein n=1 Tax=Magnaporthiopsis poae (strain ATCC 64411 / 73-15) TaxID=644358 RepID=A0A0C4DPN2_MAGP6|nr:hypothetical protein MAPG_01803 [Magnaporthiopsis poae ATCC 64411]
MGSTPPASSSEIASPARRLTFISAVGKLAGLRLIEAQQIARERVQPPEDTVDGRKHRLFPHTRTADSSAADDAAARGPAPYLSNLSTRHSPTSAGLSHSPTSDRETETPSEMTPNIDPIAELHLSRPNSRSQAPSRAASYTVGWPNLFQISVIAIVVWHGDETKPAAAANEHLSVVTRPHPKGAHVRGAAKAPSDLH